MSRKPDQRTFYLYFNGQSDPLYDFNHSRTNSEVEHPITCLRINCTKRQLRTFVKRFLNRSNLIGIYTRPGVEFVITEDKALTFVNELDPLEVELKESDSQKKDMKIEKELDENWG